MVVHQQTYDPTSLLARSLITLMTQTPWVKRSLVLRYFMINRESHLSTHAIRQQSSHLNCTIGSTLTQVKGIYSKESIQFTVHVHID